MANKEITMWSAPIVFEQIKQGPPGAQGAPGPAGPVYGITCSVQQITRGLTTPIFPTEISFNASKIAEDGKIQNIELSDSADSKNYILLQHGFKDIQQGEGGETNNNIVFSDILHSSPLIGYSDKENVEKYKTKILYTTGIRIENDETIYGYAGEYYIEDQLRKEKYHDAVSIKAQLFIEGNLVVELSIPFVLSQELTELSQIKDGQVVISDGKVISESIVSDAVTAKKIAAGSISTDKFEANRIVSHNFIDNIPEFNRDEQSPDKYSLEDYTYTSQGTLIELNKGTIHTKNFYVDENGNAGFKGMIYANGGSIIGTLGIGQQKDGSYSVFIDGSNTAVYALNVNDNFTITPNGDIVAKTGQIAGWKITTEALQDQNNNVGLYSGSNTDYFYNSSPIRFYAGSLKDNNKPYNFFVTENGKLYAESAQISGEINAISGKISGDFYVGDSKNGILIDGKDASLQSIPYASGVSGWKIDKDGNAEFYSATIRGKLQSVIFEANTVSAVGGDLYIAPTIQIPAKDNNIGNLSYEEGESLSSYTITVKNKKGNNEYYALYNDWNEAIVLLNMNIVKNNEEKKFDDIQGFLTMTSEESYDTFKIIIDSQTLDNANKSKKGELDGAIFKYELIIIKLGQKNSRRYIYLTANHLTNSHAPYIDIQDYTSDSNKGLVSDLPRVRLGNLSGIALNEALFGTNQKLEGYGLYSDRAYLTGLLALPNAGVTNQSKVGYDGGKKYISTDLEKTAIRIWAGSSMPIADGETIAPFIVTQDGSLYATQGIFEGIIKAKNSVFEGTITAAGILVDNSRTDPEPIEGKKHFYIGYSESPTSPNDYILDIDSKGLRIWEGGLNIYSDYLSGWNASDTTSPTGTVYSGYGYSSSNTNPLPYISAIDQGRLAVKDINIMSPTFSENILKSFSSITSNEGKLYFGTTINYSDTLAFNTLETTLNNTNSSSGYIGSITKGLLLSSIDNETQFILKSSGFIQATVETLSLSNENKEVKFQMGETKIQEVKSNGKTIGINFIV